MYQVCIQNADGDSFHLVHEQNILFKDFLAAASKAMNLSGVVQVSANQEDITDSERLYHNRVGAIFHPYLNSEPKFFDTTNLQEVRKKAALVCPPLDEQHIHYLMSYAMKKNFGINIQKALRRLG
jgi:hypothetical protein